jgi:DNA-binding GntR family transcriptional regulator
MANILDAIEAGDTDNARARCVFHVRKAAEAAQIYFQNAESVEDAG